MRAQYLLIDKKQYILKPTNQSNFSRPNLGILPLIFCIIFVYNLGASFLDNFPDDLREVVHPHWGNFPPQHPLIVDFLGRDLLVLQNQLLIYYTIKPIYWQIPIILRCYVLLFVVYLILWKWMCYYNFLMYKIS